MRSDALRARCSYRVRPVNLSDFDFELPPSSIATKPMEPRDRSRLCVVDRSSGSATHEVFCDLPTFLRPGDLLVRNDTRVRPWRLCGRRKTGGKVECLILQLRGSEGEGFVKPSKKLAPGDEVAMEGGAITLRLLEQLDGGHWRFELRAEGGDVSTALERHGRAPLPPYIQRTGDEDPTTDRERYQTVFARVPGAVAAPTAGLHFTDAVFDALAARGVEIASVTLHVGEGTFAPMRTDVVEEHRMHAEEYELPAVTADAIARTRARGGRVVAVGTTSCRTLETCANDDRTVTAGRGSSSIYLYPGRPFRVVDALITNFHLPKSTLILLVAAFAGKDRILSVYRDAIERGYRFYSYGDAMLIV